MYRSSLTFHGRCRSAAQRSPKRFIFGVEDVLTSVHQMTGLPWFATFALSTIAVRVSLLPLVRAQYIQSRRLAEGMPKVEYLFKLLSIKLRKAPSTSSSSSSSSSRESSPSKLGDIRLAWKGAQAVFHLHEVSLMKLFAFPILNIGIFATFIFSLRDMITGSQRAELSTGGILWFTDLISKDASYALPLTAVAVSYIAMEVAFRRDNAQKNGSSTLLFFKDAFQSVLIVSLPFIVQMPSGLFFYWIPSSLCGIAQSMVFRDPLLREKIMGIPPAASPDSAVNTVHPKYDKIQA